MIKLILFDFFGVLVFSERDLIFNQELLDFIAKQKETYQTAILSNSGILLKNKLVLKNINQYFDKIFLASDFNLTKSDPEIYQLVAKRFNLNTKEILFIDDQQWRIDAAKEAGCQVILFENNQQLFDTLSL